MLHCLAWSTWWPLLVKHDDPQCNWSPFKEMVFCIYYVLWIWSFFHLVYSSLFRNCENTIHIFEFPKRPSAPCLVKKKKTTNISAFDFCFIILLKKIIQLKNLKHLKWEKTSGLFCRGTNFWFVSVQSSKKTKKKEMQPLVCADSWHLTFVT